MNLFKTRVVVIKNTQTGEYLTDLSIPKTISDPSPRICWGELNDALLFASGNEVRRYAQDHLLVSKAVTSGAIKFISIPVELHIDKVVNIAGTRC